MITKEDLEKFYEVSGEAEIEDLLNAWDIDFQAFADFTAKIANTGIRDIFIKRDPQLTIGTIFLIGFEMGYKASLEQELRRIANE